MQLHQLQSKTHRMRSRQVGRGGRRGKTSGRGTKGQNARSGRKKRPELRDIIKTLPKLRGRGVNIFKSLQSPFTVVNLDLINKHFKDSATVSPQTLVNAGLAERYKGKLPRVKILAAGDIAKKVSMVDVTVSAEAKTKVEKAGGTVK